MNRDLLNLYAFLVGLCIAAAALLPFGAHAAVTVTPSMPQWIADAHGIANGLKAFNAGELPYNASNYSASGTTSIGGKPLTIPAKVPLSSAAGQIAKSAMRANPYLLAGSLALPWLLDQGMEWVEGEGWQYTPSDYEVPPQDIGWDTAQELPSCNGSMACGPAAGYTCLWSHDVNSYTLVTYQMGTTEPPGWTYANACHESLAQVFMSPAYLKTRVTPSGAAPATDEDWNALPDPSSTVAPELPEAPYMGDKGAPVGVPQYEDGDYPLGDPYKAADGSTVQPMATVTNNTYNNSVTISTYNLTTHDSNGDPIPAPTPEPTEEKPSQCEENPESLGCLQLGTVPDSTVPTETRDIPLITPVEVGGVGSCPAPIAASFMGQPLEFSFDFPCAAADMLRPLVLALAWLAAGLIFIQGVRQ